MLKGSLHSILLLFLPVSCLAQPQGTLIDRVIGVVGREAILYSELSVRLEQARQGGALTPAARCGALEDLLYEKLLLEHAALDSVVVDQAQVDAELDRRIRYFSAQLGGDSKLEEFYGKTITEIRAEFRAQVEDQLLVQNMQQRITADVRVTPRDVQRFYNSIPADSIPLINAEVEYAQIVREPKPDETEERRVRRKIEEYRESVSKGEKEICIVAMLYSEDPGSAKDCGELGLVPLGTMVPEFDAVAMSLKEGEVSQVFKTEYGYHFMQMVERRGEYYNARHVLMRPQLGNAELQKERTVLDSLVKLVRSEGGKFSALAAEFSEDADSKDLGGMVIEQNNNSSRWDMGALDQQTFFVLDKLKAGEVSEPQLIVLPDGSKAYRVLQLISHTPPHKANLKDDYRMIQQAAEGKLRAAAVEEWVSSRLDGTYVRLNKDYHGCTFTHDWAREQAGN